MILSMVLCSQVFANQPKETIEGFNAKQTEVVFKAFDILNAQMWDTLTQQDLLTLSQAAAIAMDTKNEHYNPKAAYNFMKIILDVTYDYHPINELTQKVFKSAILSIMRGDYRFSSEEERVIRNEFEFMSDLRQMREMLKKATLVEQRKANECTFVYTLNPVLATIKAEYLEKFKTGQECYSFPKKAKDFCDTSYNNKDFCSNAMNSFESSAECAKAKTDLVKLLTNVPACANSLKVSALVPVYINIEQIDKTIALENTELAFNMGLSFTNPETQTVSNLIKDFFHVQVQNDVEVEEGEDEEDNFDIDAVSTTVKVSNKPQAIEAPKTKKQQVEHFASTMEAPRAKTFDQARNQKPLAIGAGTPKAPAQQQQATQPKQGLWSKFMGMFGF